MAQRCCSRQAELSLVSVQVCKQTLRGSDVTESKKGYFCERSDCKFGLWRDNKFLAAKKINLTKKMASSLLTDKCTYASGIYSEKTGKNYDAYIILEDDGTRSSYKLDFAKEGR